MSEQDRIDAVEPAARLSHEQAVRKRQRSRALVTGLALAAFAILLYAITIARLGSQ